MAGKLTGLFGKLFGGGGEAPAETAEGERGEAEDYNGFKIYPAPKPSGSQWNLAGYVAKEVDGEVKEHYFIRADTYASKDDAVRYSLRKGRQLVDEQGAKLFL